MLTCSLKALSWLMLQYTDLESESGNVLNIWYNNTASGYLEMIPPFNSYFDRNVKSI